MEGLRLVYIFNIIEDVIDTLNSFDKCDRNKFTTENSIWYNQPEILSIIGRYPNRRSYHFVMLRNVDEQFILYACQLFQIQRSQIQILIPYKENQSNSVSLSVLEDEQLLKKLKQFGKFDLLSYCMSDELLQLYDTLRDQANPLEITLKQNWEKIKRFSTKPGIRQMIDDLKDERIFMPKGKIFYRSESYFEDTINFMVNKLKNQSVVVKTEKLSGGKGVTVIKKQQVEGFSQSEIEGYIRQKMSKPFWKNFDIVVEDFIEIDMSIGPPYIQIQINKQGNVQFVWVCSMFIVNQSQFDGIQCGREIFKKQLYDQMMYIGMKLGKAYSALGYTGNIAIDFLIDKKGVVYVGESNVRRGWPIFVHNFTELMHGKQYYLTKHVRTHLFQSQKLVPVTLNHLLDEIKKMGLDYNKNKGSGIVLSSSVGCFRDSFIIFFTITDNRAEAEVMGKKLKQLYL